MINDILNNLDTYFIDYWDSKGIENIHQYQGKQFNNNVFNNSMLYVHSNYVYQFQDLINNYDYDLLNYLINFTMSVQLEFNIVSLNTFLLLALGNLNNSYIYHCINFNGSNNLNNSYGYRCDKASEQSRRLLKNYLDFYQGLAVDKLNDSNLGLTVNANNNKNMGLMYNRQALQDSISLKKCISIADLPRLE